MDWIFKSASDIPQIIVSVFLFTTIVILYTRIFGLRSFSKMSSFDFAITVAFGSILGSVIITKEPRIFQGAIALGALYVIQYLISFTKSRNKKFSKLVDNEPMVLMNKKGFIEHNLKKARVTKDEIRDKLREANVIQLSEIKGVIFETTGDISVLHGDKDKKIDTEIIKNVLDRDLLN